MIDRLLKNKDVIVKCSHLIPGYSMDSKVWSKLTELHTVLEECYKLTKYLSRTDVLPTDCYIKWMECRFTIQQKHEESMTHKYLDNFLSIILSVFVNSNCYTF